MAGGGRTWRLLSAAEPFLYFLLVTCMWLWPFFYSALDEHLTRQQSAESFRALFIAVASVCLVIFAAVVAGLSWGVWRRLGVLGRHLYLLAVYVACFAVTVGCLELGGFDLAHFRARFYETRPIVDWFMILTMFPFGLMVLLMHMGGVVVRERIMKRKQATE